MNIKFEYDLERFVDAQDRVYQDVLVELAAGRNIGDWIWFIFPRIAGLGASRPAMFYALSERQEAAAYLEHPVLGARLIECTKAAIAHRGGGAEALFGDPGEAMFQASMSLFSRVKDANPIFIDALDGFFGGIGDRDTLDILRLAFVASLDD